jgi:SAM-dependent methyltransferase
MREGVYHQYAETLEGHWWVEHRRGIIGHWLRQLGIEPGRSLDVLELGSGVGVEFDFFAQFGAVTGVELSPVGAEYCRRKGYAALLEGDLNHTDLGQARFDLAADFHVLYHRWIDDPAKVLRGVYDALRPGGTLILTEPAFEILRRGHDDAVMAARRWSRRELVELVEGAGFRIQRFSAMLTLVAPGALFGALFDRFRKTSSDVRELQRSSPVTDNVIRTVLALERALIRVGPLPLGTCWALVAQKPRT